MNILQYDLDNYNIEDVEEVVRYLNHHGFKTIAIPRDFTLLLDVDSYTLHMLKQRIEDAIRKKEIIDNM
jgi:energy-coupling factor transporter ATP-binding protein EcfA2